MLMNFGFFESWVNPPPPSKIISIVFLIKLEGIRQFASALSFIIDLKSNTICFPSLRRTTLTMRGL